MRRLWIGLVVVVLGAGCIAHEKNGDSAAALGDWRSAYLEYGQALENDSKNTALAEKYQHARAQALEQGIQKAQGCATTGDWSCALEQADFVLSVEAGNRDMATLRVTAAKAASLGWIDQARDEGGRGNYAKSFELLGRAVSTSKDPEVAQGALAVRAQVLKGLDADVDRLRAQQSYPQAIQLLELAAPIDSGHRARLETLRVEYNGWLEAQYEQRARAGDAALAAKRWNEAAANYQAALAIHPGGRAEPLLRYAAGIDRGEQALARQDLHAATASFREAVASGLDRDGYAASMLQRVEVRPYVIRLRSVLVYPFRMNGLPWGGRRDPSIEQLLRVAAVNAFPRGEPAPERAIATARALPLEFAPVIQAEAVVPDRGVLVTGPVRGFFTVFDASFVAVTNAFDPQTIQIRIRHVGGGPEEIGAFAIPLRDLITTGRLLVVDRAVARLELVAEPANGIPPDTLVGWGVPPPPNTGYPSAYPPGPPQEAYGPPGHLRIADIGIRMGHEDIRVRHPGLASPLVELFQGDRLIYRNQADRSMEGQWAPVGVHVNPNDRIHIRIFDTAMGAPVLVLETWVDPSSMQNGVYETRTLRGTWVRVRFASPGRRGPP